MDWYQIDGPPSQTGGLVRVTDAHGRGERVSLEGALLAIEARGGGVCVPDVYALARDVAAGGSRPASPDAVRVFRALAAENRVLCRAVARRLGSPTGGAPTELLAGLAVPGVEEAVVARHGPGGVFAATRGALALGTVSAAGLAVDPSAVGQAADSCRHLTRSRFTFLMAHPDAAAMYRNGSNAVVDHKGFYPVVPDRMRAWLRDQLATVTDRLRLPVPMPLDPGGETDLQVRHWPLWAVGTGPLAALADLQDAQYLGHALARAGDQCRPAFRDPLVPLPADPDLAAYARLRATGLLPPCFVPEPGATFVRVDLSALPLALLPAPRPPAEELRRAVRTATRVDLTRDQTLHLTALAASGASDATVAVGLGRLGALPVTRDQAGGLVRALVRSVPGLAAHLADPTPDRLERYTRATGPELAEWTGHHAPEAGREGSLLRAFLASALFDEFQVIGPDHDELLARLRARGVRPPAAEPAGTEFDFRRGCYRFLERELVTNRFGEEHAAGTWVEARGTVAAAQRGVSGVAFALLAAGRRVVAVTPREILVEVPADGSGAAAEVGAEVRTAVADLTSPAEFPPPEAVERW